MVRVAVLLAFSVLVLACGPIGPFPGGRLSGSVAADLPGDWSFADGRDTVQLETRSSSPYSVNLWGAGIGDRFYLASGGGGDARWVRYIAEDPNVRLRVGDTIYELRAVRVADDEERERFLAALKRKYDWKPEPEQSEEAWLFRLEPRREKP